MKDAQARALIPYMCPDLDWRDQQREVVLGLLILVVPHDAQRKIARSGGCLIPNNTGLRGQFSLVGLVILRQVKISVCVC